MQVLVLPVSGGGFATQLGILELLCEINYVPDITLASSGGNVAAYIAAAADWKWPGIERISKELTQSLFIKPWSSMGALSSVIGYFKGDIFEKGDGVVEFLSEYFTEESVSKYEIWTGTYNKDRRKTRLFCNRGSEDTIMDASCIDKDLTQSMDPVFAGGNIDMISQASIASASIPALVPPQKIMGEDYIDGGVSGASPLTLMREPILKRARECWNGGPVLHVVYVNSVDLSETNVLPINNILDTWKQAAKNMIRFQTVIDRLSGYELLGAEKEEINSEEFACNSENMDRVKQIHAIAKCSMLEIYPTRNFDIELSKFSGEDVIKAIRGSYKNCRCRLWWASGDFNDVVKDIAGKCSAGE